MIRSKFHEHLGYLAVGLSTKPFVSSILSLEMFFLLGKATSRFSPTDEYIPWGSTVVPYKELVEGF